MNRRQPARRGTAVQDGFFAPPAAPLAARMRPRRLEDFVGQRHLVAPGRPLAAALAGQIGSLILWGPPGSGKTTLAYLLADRSGAACHVISAVSEGVPELKRIVAEARRARAVGQRTMLVVDEVHRWSKTQQAALLPHVEDGTLALCGLTTENPYFDLIAPLRSRLRILRLEPLTREDLRTIILRALTDSACGLGRPRQALADEALDALVDISGGDARIALNALEAAAMLARQDGEPITAEHVLTVVQRRQVRYDQKGDDHYQTISAFIKSLRGDDPDAGVFWLAKMLEAGEDPRFIARRLIILASEDIGNADPQALLVANAAAEAVERVGMPEALFALGQATLYLAMAPKSNAVKDAYGAARATIERGANLEVPLHLRNASFGGAQALGYSAGYAYSHAFDPDDPERYRQRYLPEGVPEGAFYRPRAVGYEAEHARRLERLRELRAKARGGPPAAQG